MIESIDLVTAPGAREKLGSTINAITLTQRQILSLVTPAWQAEVNPNLGQITSLQSKFRELVQARDDLIGPFEGLTDHERFALGRSELNEDTMDARTYPAVNEVLKNPPRRIIFTDPQRQVAIIDDQPVPFQSPAEFAAFEVMTSIPVYNLNTVQNIMLAWLSSGGRKKLPDSQRPISTKDVIDILRKRLKLVGVNGDDIQTEKNYVGSRNQLGKLRWHSESLVYLDRTKYQRFVDEQVLQDNTIRKLALKG